jgi:hypothetical protein
MCEFCGRSRTTGEVSPSRAKERPDESRTILGSRLITVQIKSLSTLDSGHTVISKVGGKTEEWRRKRYPRVAKLQFARRETADFMEKSQKSSRNVRVTALPYGPARGRNCARNVTQVIQFSRTAVLPAGLGFGRSLRANCLIRGTYHKQRVAKPEHT